MASRTVTVDSFASAIEEILKEYDDKAGLTLNEAVQKVSKEGVRLVKANSGIFGGKGKYKSGWTSQIETGRMSAQGTIYNSKVPGLPHLLEHGHAKRGGGRVGGRVHIAPVEEQIIKQFEAELEKRLSS